MDLILCLETISMSALKPTPPVHFLCQILVKDERQEACEKVCLDTVVPLGIHRTRLEVCLRDAEAVFNYPPPPLMRIISPGASSRSVQAHSERDRIYEKNGEELQAVCNTSPF